jgi:hypothetical protein
MVWQLQQVEALASQPSPDPRAVEAIAIPLARFLQAAPADFLDALLASPFGRVYRLFLERCCTQPLSGTAADQLKQDLSQQLRVVGFASGEGHALLLALMPFYAPGNLKVEDAPAKLPGWLLEIYRLRYEPSTAPHSAEQPSQAPADGRPSFSDRIFLNRMLGLSNLYYIDPEDQEILQELRQVRLQTVELLLSCDSRALGEHFSADFGDRYWAMAQSGVQKEALDSHELAQRDAIQRWLSTTPNSLHAEGGIQRFAAALLFSEPGSVRLATPEKNLPTWFLEGYKRFCSMTVSA